MVWTKIHGLRVPGLHSLCCTTGSAILNNETENFLWVGEGDKNPKKDMRF